jgi:thiosulfate/3-mercaptopyruvate sulfurtransferase
MDFTTLIDADTLRTVPASTDLLFVDCRFDLADPSAGERAHAQAHIPGAVYAHLDRDLSGPVTAATGRHPLPDPAVFAEILSRWGIAPSTQVVAYDASGGVIAARLWWMLGWLGHARVAVLDGGLAAWCAAGGSLDRSVAARQPTRFVAEPEKGAAVSTAELADLLEAGGCLLVDARSAERFEGRNEPIDPVAGHVPGAVNFACQANLSADGRFLGRDALRSAWARLLAGRPAEAIVGMCGSGVTACHNLLALEHAGLGRGRLYPGSWSEWIRDPTRPVARGPA